MAAIFFDLDGTLTDSGEGITKCAQVALEHFGIHIEDRSQLRFFVGPPLRESFPMIGVREEDVEEAVRLYRVRYNSVGKFENTPYPGIRELLTQLQGEGYDLYVATSKPESTAIEILEKFDLAKYFRIICGAEMDGKRDKKDAVIAYLLEQLPQGEKILMVGDTAFDVIGAKTHKIPCLGVSWGYGDVEEMTAAGAIGIANTMEQLLELIKTNL